MYYFCRIFEIPETPALESSTEEFVENLLISTSSFILNSASGKHFKIVKLVIFTPVTTPGLLWVKNILYTGSRLQRVKRCKINCSLKVGACCNRTF